MRFFSSTSTFCSPHAKRKPRPLGSALHVKMETRGLHRSTSTTIIASPFHTGRNNHTNEDALRGDSSHRRCKAVPRRRGPPALTPTLLTTSFALASLASRR
ncbi:hypothetical protein SORBI_3004G133750 [Sorghum bicolor]|uniref:Uncharacterized protein n=1 Tax=Sorghum bicolor TaxID=4558 RepID=A0A1Z5RMF6_SORBI|nr:hypothetical protein SORBI_3004G133750 [Sorghum bicolor]